MHCNGSLETFYPTRSHFLVRQPDDGRDGHDGHDGHESHVVLRVSNLRVYYNSVVLVSTDILSMHAGF